MLDCSEGHLEGRQEVSGDGADHMGNEYSHCYRDGVPDQVVEVPVGRRSKERASHRMGAEGMAGLGSLGHENLHAELEIHPLNRLHCHAPLLHLGRERTIQKLLVPPEDRERLPSSHCGVQVSAKD